MRRAGFTLFAWLVAAPALFAQAPPTEASPRVPTPGAGVPVGVAPGGVPVAVPPAAPQTIPAALLTHLQAWEKTMGATSNFYTECKLTRNHLILKKSTEFTGSIMCMKPNLARMRIEEVPADPKKNNYMAYICNGRAVYQYDGSAKQMTEYALPNGGVGDNLLLEFMSGSLKTNDIIQRFEIRILKEDANYLYLELKPRVVKDKAEFETMTLVLFQPSVPQLGYLPSMVVMRSGNGQEEEHWNFMPKQGSFPRINVEGIKKEHFEAQPPPADWKVQKAQQARPATTPGPPPNLIVRPSGN